MAADHHDQEPAPVPLAALDPREDPERHDLLVGRIMAQVRPLLATRRRSLQVWAVFAAWRRPVFTGAAAVAAGALVVLLTVHAETGAAAAPGGAGPTTLAEAAGIPARWARWVAADENPDVSDVLREEWSRP